MKHAYQAALLELPFRAGISAAARRMGGSGDRSRRALALPAARGRHHAAAALYQLLPTLAARAERIRAMVVPGLVPRRATIEMGRFACEARSNSADRNRAGAFELHHRLLCAVLAVVFGVVFVWAAVEFVVGVSRFAATHCAAEVRTEGIGSSASRAEPERLAGFRPLGILNR